MYICLVIESMEKVDNQSGIDYMDFDWNDFLEKLFNKSPLDPFTFTLSFLDITNKQKISELLGHMLVTGAKQKYNKVIADLLPPEIDELQKYYHSIGFKVEYHVEIEQHYFAELNKTIPVNLFQIDFLPYSRLYDQYNRPEKIL